MNMRTEPLGRVLRHSHIYSATGNANMTKPRQGFQDPKLAQVFATHSDVSGNRTKSVTILPSSDHSQNKLPLGAIVGGIVGGFVLVLVTALCFLRRRHRKVAAPQQSREMSASSPVKLQELRAPSLVKSQELEERHELQHRPITVFELPMAPIQHNGSIPEKEKRSMDKI